MIEKILREKTFNWLLLGAWDGLSWETTDPVLHGSCFLCIWDHRLQWLWIPFLALQGKKDPWVRGLGLAQRANLAIGLSPKDSLCLRLPSDQGKFQITDKMQIKGWHYPCLSVCPLSPTTIPSPLAQVAALALGREAGEFQAPCGASSTSPCLWL